MTSLSIFFSVGRSGRRNVFFFHSNCFPETSLTAYCRNGFPDARLLGTEGLNTSWLAWRAACWFRWRDGLLSALGRTPIRGWADTFRCSGGMEAARSRLLSETNAAFGDWRDVCNIYHHPRLWFHPDFRVL